MSEAAGYFQANVTEFDTAGRALGGARYRNTDRGVPGYWDSTGFRPVDHFGFGGGIAAGNGTLLFGVAHEFAPDGTQIGRATLWNYDGQATHITGLGDLFAHPWGINADGTYAGITRVVLGPNAGQVATFVGRDGWAVPMSYPGYDLTRAYDINDDGWIVGVYNAPGTFTPHRGYVAKAFDTEIRDLGLLDDPLVNGVWPHEINNVGEIVGAATSGNAFRIALYWPPGATEPIDLNTLVSIPGETRLVEAMDINNSGQILARGFNGYYILTPVPEPGAVGLAAAGVIALRRARPTQTLRW